MSKSYGEEFLIGIGKDLKVGAEENGIDEDKALKIWKNINTMGSWAFNRKSCYILWFGQLLVLCVKI